MTKNEIIDISKLRREKYSKCLTFEIYSDLFCKSVICQIFFNKIDVETYEITDQLLSSVNHIISFITNKKILIGKLCFQHYEKCISYTDYMTPKDLLTKYNNDYSKANKELFGIYNEDEAFNSIGLNSIDFLEQNNEGFMDIWTILNFSVPWENEHGMKINFKNQVFKRAE